MGRGQGILSGLLRGADWNAVTDYLSPRVLDVVAVSDLRRQAVDLSRSYMRPGAWRTYRDEHGFKLGQVFPGIEVGDFSLPSQRMPASSEQRSKRAQLLLELYFFQIQHLPTALLDLRSSRFSPPSTTVNWNPTPLKTTWSDNFIHPLRELYAGFYGDDNGRFEAALDALKLTAAGHIFREHFGSGDQSAVRFSLEHFRYTFHETFAVCKNNRSRLHANFIPLGIMLACLYEHLEKLDVPCDVRTAYQRATSYQ